MSGGVSPLRRGSRVSATAGRQFVVGAGTLCLLGALAFAASFDAQSTTGTPAGSIADATGNAAPNTRVIAPSAAAGPAVGDDSDRLVRVLRVGSYTSDESLFDYVDRAGVRHGFAASALHAIADPHAIVLVYRRFGSAGAALAALGAGRIDILPVPCAIAAADERYWVSEPYALPQAGAVIRRERAKPRALADLAALRVAIEDGERGGLAKAWLPSSELVEIDDARSGARMVAHGNVDAFVGIHEANLGIVETQGLHSLESVPLPLAVPLCFIARRDDAAAVSLVASGLARLPAAERREIQLQPLPSSVAAMSEQSFELTEEERRWADAHPVVRVGIERLYRPYDFLDDEGEWQGVGAALLKRLAQVAQIRFEPVLIDDARTLADALREGTIDLATSFPLGAAAAEPRGLAFSRPYDGFPWSFVRFGGAAGRPARIAANVWRLRRLLPAEAWANATIVPRERAADALRAVLAGNADAALVNTIAAEDLRDRYPYGRLSTDSAVAGVERIGFAATASNTVLIGMVDRYLASYSSRELARLASRSRHVSLQLGYDKGAVILLSVCAAAIVVTVLVTLLMAYWRTRTARHAADAARLEAIASRERAEAADRAKSAFVAMMSHEIRTPMNGVIGVLDLFETTTLTAQQRRYLEIAQRSGRLMLRVIDDTLDYLKLEQGALSLDALPFDVHQLVAAAIELHAPLADRKGVRVYLASMPRFDRYIIGDEARVNQIVTNLLSNAIRFTDDGHVMVAAQHRLERGRSELELVVTDTGRGIADHYRSRLFTPFTQQDSSTTRRYGGTGLGLSIVKRLVDAMGGTIEVASAVGVGTRIAVRWPIVWGEPLERADSRGPDIADVPIRAAAVDSMASRWSPCEGGVAGKVLVVEDNEMNRDIIVRQLAALGVPASAAPDGLAGYASWERLRPSFVFLDCHMPGMDGYELARRIRAGEADRQRRGEAAARTAIVAISANATTEDRDACREAGMDEYLSKPITRDKLIAVFEKFKGAGNVVESK